MHILGAFIALAFAGGLIYAGYLMLKHKGPFKDSSSGSGSGGGGGKPGSDSSGVSK